MFKLVRYFSISSLVAFIVVTVGLAYFYRENAVDDLIALRENNNVALTQAFSNSLWSDFAPFVETANEFDADELREHPQTEEFFEMVSAQMQGLSVIKVKVYDLNALTVFSTENAQIGEDKSNNAGYLAARDGLVATELTHRDSFSAFEQTIEDRDVISSYVPIQPGGPGTAVEGVFEVYDDVTPLLSRIDRTQQNIILGVVLILAALYVTLFIIVRRGENIIKQQQVELQQREEAVRKARDEAVEALKVREQILANVSHDARTPLTAITLAAEMLQNGIYGKLEEVQQKQMKTIVTSARQLLFFVNNLLTEAQINAGRLKLAQLAFSPAQLLEDVEATMTPLVMKKGLKLVLEKSDTVPETLQGDFDRLGQILFNLVGNAVKFTDEGSISVCFEQPDEKHWAMRVVDTGSGIPADQRERIFEAFWQVDGSNTRQSASGVGLGLSIVKQLTTLMGGKAAVESQVGTGSTFIITLPMQKPEGAASDG